MSSDARACIGLSGERGRDIVKPAPDGCSAQPPKFSKKYTGRTTVSGRRSARKWFSIAHLLSKCGTLLSRSAPPTDEYT